MGKVFVCICCCKGEVGLDEKIKPSLGSVDLHLHVGIYINLCAIIDSQCEYWWWIQQDSSFLPFHSYSLDNIYAKT